MATFWRTFHHDGKISPAWWGWGVNALPLLLYLPSRVTSKDVVYTLQLREQIHSPYFSYALCGWHSQCALYTVQHRVLLDLKRTRLSWGRMIRLLPPPFSRQQVVSLSQSSCVSPVELTDGGAGGGGAKVYDSEKARSSINYSILSAVQWTWKFVEPCHSFFTPQLAPQILKLKRQSHVISNNVEACKIKSSYLYMLWWFLNIFALEENKLRNFDFSMKLFPNLGIYLKNFFNMLWRWRYFSNVPYHRLD
jgi:hypothetical protein